MKQCLMLAAGLSSRMGTWKMLLPWGDSTVLDCALDNALAFCDRVILVTGYRGTELLARYQGTAGISLCHNANYQEGMFSSIQAGAQQLEAGDFFIVPGDMPLIDSEVYATLWRHRTRRVCLVPEYAAGFGHPVLLPEDMRETLITAAASCNLRQLMIRRGREGVPVGTAAIHWDLDTPEHYRCLTKA